MPSNRGADLLRGATHRDVGGAGVVGLIVGATFYGTWAGAWLSAAAIAIVAWVLSLLPEPSDAE